MPIQQQTLNCPRYRGCVVLFTSDSVAKRREYHLGAAAIRIAFDTAVGKRFIVDSGDLSRYGRPILKDPYPGRTRRLAAVGFDLWKPNASDKLGRRTGEGHQQSSCRRRILDYSVICRGKDPGDYLQHPYTRGPRENTGDSGAHRHPMAISATDIYCAHSEETISI